MVIKKATLVSTYQKSFKSRFPECALVYATNVDYRVNRRRNEHYHSADPFSWDYESENDVESNGFVIIPQVGSQPIHKYKHDKFSKAYQEKIKDQMQIKHHDYSMHVFSPKHEVLHKENEKQELVEHIAIQTEPQDSLENGDIKVKAYKQERSQKEVKQLQTPPATADVATQISRNGVCQRYHKKCAAWSRHSQPLPKPKPMSAPIGRVLHTAKTETPADVERPPFVTYGFSDKDGIAGTMRTHNIRASAEIYPSALRAQKRKQLDIEKKEEAARKASLRDRRKQALFNDFNVRMQRETSQWDTEYRSHFVGYDKCLYERSLSGRPSPYKNKESLAATL